MEIFRPVNIFPGKNVQKENKTSAGIRALSVRATGRRCALAPDSARVIRENIEVRGSDARRYGCGKSKKRG